MTWNEILYVQIGYYTSNNTLTEKIRAVFQDCHCTFAKMMFFSQPKNGLKLIREIKNWLCIILIELVNIHQHQQMA